MKETLQKEISELMEMKEMIQSELFQKYIAKPMKAERDRLRTAFFSDSLKESWRKGGKQEGIKLFMDIIESIHTDLKNKTYEYDTLEDSEGR